MLNFVFNFQSYNDSPLNLTGNPEICHRRTGRQNSAYAMLLSESLFQNLQRAFLTIKPHNQIYCPYIAERSRIFLLFFIIFVLL